MRIYNADFDGILYEITNAAVSLDMHIRTYITGYLYEYFIRDAAEKEGKPIPTVLFSMLSHFKHVSLAQPAKEEYSEEDLQLEFDHCFVPETPVTLLANLSSHIFTEPEKAFIIIEIKEEKEMADAEMGPHGLR